MTLHPSKMPELRARAVAARESEVGKAAFKEVHQQSRGVGSEVAERYWWTEKSTLKTATLFHVSEEMSRLSVIAAQVLTDFHIRPWDAPSEVGLIWFDGVIGESEGLPIRAASWVIGPAPSVAAAIPTPDGGSVWVDEDGRAWNIFVTFYTSPSDFPGSEQDAAKLSALFGPLVADWEEGFTCGDGRVPPKGGHHAYLALVSAWLLMQQHVADVVDLQIPPSLARKYVRRGYDRAPVRVVTLGAHHAPPGLTDPGGGREYHHRWVVRGHWRNQWFPKQKRHVPMWISPHVKGPSGAPILDKRETVYAWK